MPLSSSIRVVTRLTTIQPSTRWKRRANHRDRGPETLVPHTDDNSTAPSTTGHTTNPSKNDRDETPVTDVPELRTGRGNRIRTHNNQLMILKRRDIIARSGQQSSWQCVPAAAADVVDDAVAPLWHKAAGINFAITRSVARKKLKQQ